MGKFLRGVGIALGLGGAAAGGVEGYRKMSPELSHMVSAVTPTPNVELSLPAGDDPLVVVKDPETGAAATIGRHGEIPYVRISAEHEQALDDYFKKNEKTTLGRKYKFGLSHGRDRAVIQLNDKRFPSIVAYVRTSFDGKLALTDQRGEQLKVLGSVTDLTPALLDDLDKPTYAGVGEQELPRIENKPEVAEAPVDGQPLPRLPDSVKSE